MTNNPIEAVQSLFEAWNAKNPEKMKATMADDASFVNVFGRWMRSSEEVFEAHQMAFNDALKDAHLTILEMQIHRQSGDLAVVQVEWKIEGAKSPPGNGEGHFTLITEQVNGTWCIVAVHNTSRALAELAIQSKGEPDAAR